MNKQSSYAKKFDADQFLKQEIKFARIFSVLLGTLGFIVLSVAGAVIDGHIHFKHPKLAVFVLVVTLLFYYFRVLEVEDDHRLKMREIYREDEEVV